MSKNVYYRGPRIREVIRHAIEVFPGVPNSCLKTTYYKGLRIIEARVIEGRGAYYRGLTVPMIDRSAV